MKDVVCVDQLKKYDMTQEELIDLAYIVKTKEDLIEFANARAKLLMEEYCTISCTCGLDPKCENYMERHNDNGYCYLDLMK